MTSKKIQQFFDLKHILYKIDLIREKKTESEKQWGNKTKGWTNLCKAYIWPGALKMVLNRLDCSKWPNSTRNFENHCLKQPNYKTQVCWDGSQWERMRRETWRNKRNCFNLGPLACHSLKKDCGMMWGASCTFFLGCEFLADLTVEFWDSTSCDATGLRVRFRPTKSGFF